MQINSNDKTVRSNTVQAFKEFNFQSSTTQAKKGEQLVSRMPVFQKAFDLLVDDIVEISTENNTLKTQMGFYDEIWLEKSKSNLLKQINDKKRANLILSRKEKQMKKQ